MSFKALADELGKLADASVTQGTPSQGAGAGGGSAGGASSAQPLVKSFVFRLEDGTEVEAEDGAELVKAMSASFEEHKNELMGVIAPMATLLKSLTEQVAALSGKGQGRRSALVEMPGNPGAATTAAASKPKAGELLAKAHAAQAAGRISGMDVAVAEGYLNRGMELPEHLMARLG